MSRLLLEICPDNAADNGDAANLPPIVICSGDEAAPIALEGQPGARPVVLRLQNGVYALDQPTGLEPTALGIGRWHNAEGWKLRIIQATPGQDDLAAGRANPSWAAPELRITTYDGDRVKRLRCMLPVEEESQLVIGRNGAKADLVVEDEHVSRAHLRFFVREGKQFVEDLGSRWGSKLNDQPLTDPRALAHGDEIRLGKSSIQYICYWELLPQAEKSGEGPGGVVMPVEMTVVAAKPQAAEAPVSEVKVAEEKVPEPAPLVKTPAEGKPVDAIKPSAAPPVVVKPVTVNPPVKRNLAGFDLGGAIALVLLLLAGMAYLAYRVFHP